MHAVLISPTFRGDYANVQLRRADNVIHPLGLCSLAAQVRQCGHRATVIDAQIECVHPSDLIRRLAALTPDLIGLSVYSSRLALIQSLIVQCKELFPAVSIVLGGPHLSADPDWLYSTAADFAISGEGELPLCELLRWLATPEPRSALPPYIVSQTQPRTTPVVPYVHRDLDALPPPDYAINSARTAYHPSIISYCRLPSIAIVTSRGCPSACAFCSNSVHPIPWRAHSVAYLLREVRRLVGEEGYRDIWFFDDLFTFDRTRVIDFCHALRSERLDVTWGCFARCDQIDTELLGAMRTAGCWCIGYGLESGDAAILARIGKGETPAQMAQAVALTAAAGIETKAFFILGLPGETPASLGATIDFACSLPLDYVTFYPLSILPGTRLADFYRQFGTIEPVTDHGLIRYGNDLFVPHGFTRQQLLRCQRLALRRFYFSPAYLFRQLRKLRSWTDLQRRLLGLVSLL